MEQKPLNFDETEAYEIETFTVKISEGYSREYNAGDPEKVAEIGRAILEDFDADKEHFFILILDGKNRVKCFKHISTGTLTSSLVHPREVYRPAILWGAAGMILLHNHPSGDPTPSREDIEITERLQEVDGTLGIPILDHVIVDRQGGDYKSFQELDLI